LKEAGADLIVADVHPEAVDRAVSEFGATATAPKDIHAAEVDIFAPCAMGAILNDESIPKLKAKLICGLANNQLAEDRHGAELTERGIAYVPDYVVNAGGMMGASTVIFDTPAREASIARIQGVHGTIRTILDRAREEDRPSSEIADEMALSRIASEGNR